MAIIGNLADIAQSFYEMYQQINSTVTETVGLDALWMRSIPYKKGEDVIFQEYTLLNVDCPQQIKVVANKTDYNPGNLMVDLYGVNYEAPFEISIDINTWRSIYGNDTMPQKDDIVYIKILNKLFEVRSSTVSYTIAEQPTAFICQLAKYNPTVSRRESQDLVETIKDMTVSQRELFGQEISDNIFDIVDPKEFEMSNLTQRDPYRKTFDRVLSKEFQLRISNSLVSEYIYDFNQPNEGITYDSSDIFLKDSSHYRSFFCWFKFKQSAQQWNVSIKDVYNKNAEFWTLIIETAMPLKEGQTIIMSRGTNLSVNGIIKSKQESEHYLVDVKVSDALALSKKITLWYQLSAWKVSSYQNAMLIGMIDQGKENGIYLNKSEIIFRYQGKDTSFKLSKEFAVEDQWYHIGFQISHSMISIRIIDENLNLVYESQKNKKLRDLNVNEFFIKNSNIDFQLANIRLYDSDGLITLEEQRLEATTQHARNASRGIILDEASYYNPMKFIGKSK